MANINLEHQNLKGENSSAFVVLAQELLSTATRTGSKLANIAGRGILFIITTANEAGAASFTPSILVYDAAGNAVTLATFTAITANATTVLCYYPSVLTGFSGTEAKVGQLPREWALKLTYAGTPATDKIDTLVHAMYLI